MDNTFVGSEDVNMNIKTINVALSGIQEKLKKLENTKLDGTAFRNENNGKQKYI